MSERWECLGYSDKDGKKQPFFAIIANNGGGSMKEEEDNIAKRNGINYFIMMYKLNDITDKSKSEEYENLKLSKDEIKSRFSIVNR